MMGAPVAGGTDAEMRGRERGLQWRAGDWLTPCRVKPVGAVYITEI